MAVSMPGLGASSANAAATAASTVHHPFAVERVVAKKHKKHAKKHKKAVKKY
jgi:hypothetical protein